MPVEDAGCGLADMMDVNVLKKMKDYHPRAKVVCYVNSSLEIKAESDICCTSSNACNVVNSLEGDEVIFVPDKNLGRHVAENTDKKIILPESYCYVHEENIKVEHIQIIQRKYPKARTIVHSECSDEVRHIADYIGSTAQMWEFVRKSQDKSFIVGTEYNFLHRLSRDYPNKVFYAVPALCEGMNKTDLLQVVLALENMQYQIRLDEDLAFKAKKPLERMMEL